MKHSVAIRNLTKHFRRRDGAVVSAIDQATLEVTPGEFIVLLGPSGCGKTTLLRSVAGLETPDSGYIGVHGEAVFDSENNVSVGADRRNLSMVFQSYALWPHMTASQNVRYPLENRRQDRLGRQAMNQKVDDALASVGIGDLGKQYPAQLSGGQQQRVALARALVNDSNLVLFDEPLSNVDAKVREQLRIELLATQRRLGFTALFVTHDQAEAMELASRIAVLDKGRIQQIGTPDEIYSRPATEYVAKFIGNTNELRGSSDGHGTYETEVGDIHITPKRDLPESGTLLWRPEQGQLFRERPAGMNSFPGRIVASLFMGTHTEFLVRSGEIRSRLWTTGHHDFREGDDVWIGLGSQNVMIFPSSSATAQPSAEKVAAGVAP